MAERPRPRPKHRKLSNKRQSVPSSLIKKSMKKRNSELQRPRPSLTLKRKQNSNPTNPISLIQSKSNESKEPKDIFTIVINDENAKNIKLNKKQDLLEKINAVEQNQSLRKTNFDKDLNEIKQFINDNNNDDNKSNENASNSFTKNDDKYKTLTKKLNKNRDQLPTSLKLIGIRDPKSLLYHRQFVAQNLTSNGPINHNRAQSSLVSSNNNNVMNKPQNKSSFNNKYQHLRSYSSIMGSQQGIDQPGIHQLEPQQQQQQQSNKKYVQTAKNRKPSQIFGPQSNNPKSKRTMSTTLQQLADEYSSSDTDDDDDIKDNQ